MSGGRRSPLAEWRGVLGDSTLDTRAKAIGWCISFFADAATGVAWPSVTTLAEKCSIPRKAAGDAVDRLEVAGYLAVKRSKGGRPSKQGRPVSHLYKLRLPGEQFSDEELRTLAAQFSTETEPSAGRNRVNGRPKLSRQATHESVERDESGARSRARLDGGAATARCCVCDKPADLITRGQPWCDEHESENA